jgi:hypothetical protein
MCHHGVDSNLEVGAVIAGYGLGLLPDVPNFLDTGQNLDKLLGRVTICKRKKKQESPS